MKRTKRLLCITSTLLVLNAHADLTTNAEAYFAWGPMDMDSFSIWQGFDHAWKRYYLFPTLGITPHRISALSSFIKRDGNADVAEMGQRTGVDGDFMSPKLFYSTVRGAGIEHWVGSAHVKWTDTVDQSKYPSGLSRIKVPLVFPGNFSPTQSQSAVVALQGVDVNLHCDNLKQPAGVPCNSDGAWPTNFRVALVDCDRPGTNGTSCSLSLDFDRAWTPGKGGFQLPPLINEVKQINYRLDFDINVKLAIYAGSSEKLLATREHVSRWNKSLLAPIAEDTATVNDALDPLKSATVITGFSFALSPPATNINLYQLANFDIGHKGRYLARLAFKTGNPSAATFGQYKSQAGVWSPPTVVDAIADSSLSSRFVSFPAASVTPGVATGQLCNNSTDQAPWFSVWKRCGWFDYGPKQSVDNVRILTR